MTQDDAGGTAVVGLAVRRSPAQTASMFWTIGRHEQAALQMDDVASGLDAGLPLAMLGGDDRDGEQVLAGLLRRREVELSSVEATALTAAWRAGRAPVALRRRAEARRLQAKFLRGLWAAMRYPLLVLGSTVLASFCTYAVVGHLWAVVAVVGGLGGLGLGSLLLWRTMRHGGEGWFRLPLLGKLGRDLGEIPYLETLEALYAAGVPLPAAHRAAQATVPFAAVQRRLAVAERALQQGRPLAEGLAEGLGLHPETRSLLATGEASGQLEDALLRAATRRRTVAVAATERLVRWSGAVLYAGAALVAGYVVLSFYSSFAALRWR